MKTPFEIVNKKLLESSSQQGMSKTEFLRKAGVSASYINSAKRKHWMFSEPRNKLLRALDLDDKELLEFARSCFLR